MVRRPPASTHTAPPSPYPTLFRSHRPARRAPARPAGRRVTSPESRHATIFSGRCRPDGRAAAGRKGTAMTSLLPTRSAALIAAAAVMLAATAAAAHDFTLGALTLDHPWARASAGPARNGAAFLAIENAGDRSEEHTSELQSLMSTSYAV